MEEDRGGAQGCGRRRHPARRLGRRQGGRAHDHRRCGRDQHRGPTHTTRNADHEFQHGTRVSQVTSNFTGRGSHGLTISRDADHADQHLTGRGSRGLTSHGTRITRIKHLTGRGSRGLTSHRDADHVDQTSHEDADRVDQNVADHEFVGKRGSCAVVDSQRLNPRDPRPVKFAVIRVDPGHLEIRNLRLRLSRPDPWLTSSVYAVPRVPGRCPARKRAGPRRRVRRSRRAGNATRPRLSPASASGTMPFPNRIA